MYKFKIKKIEEIKKKIKIKYIAEETGLTRQYIGMVLNNKCNCKKIVAYCITKIIDENSEINDFFEKVN